MDPDPDPTTDPTATVEPDPTHPVPSATEPTLDDAGKKALASERAARREAEKAAKAANAELDRLRQSAMSDQEKAIEAARAAARAEVLAEVGHERVEAAVRAAIAGRAVDADSLIDGLDRAKFLDEDGRPDILKITQWVDRNIPTVSAPAPKPGLKDIGQGARPGASRAPQILDRSELKGMTPEQIMEARADGRLDTLLGVNK